MIAWRPGVVLKHFHAEYEDLVDGELERAAEVSRLGAPCPAVLGEATHEGRRGIEYERVDGELLLHAAPDRRDALAWTASVLADLHRTISAIRVPPGSPLPDLRVWMGRYVEHLPEGERQAASAHHDLLRGGRQLCHLDLHPGNVILGPDGPIVVDWPNACAGTLELDVARSVVLIAFQGATDRDSRDQIRRAELASRYRASLASSGELDDEQVDLASAFAADAVLRAEPGNPMGPELAALVPWRPDHPSS